MIRVGLTGTLGAGKSTVGRLFESWGAWRIDADELAREAVAPGTPGLQAIRERWGDDVIAQDGTLDRAALREEVFGDAAARRELEGIVHPEVRRLRSEQIRKAERAGAGIVVGEVPLLFETGMADEFDLVVVVDAPREVRMRRTCDDRGIDAETFAAMDAAQWSGDRKSARADHVIRNDGTLDELEALAHHVWEEIVERSEDG